MIHVIIKSLLFGFLATGPIFAQDSEVAGITKIDSLVPLQDYLARPTAEITPAYPFTRCAGLALGVKYYAGGNFDAETAARTEAGIAALRTASIVLTLEQNATRRGVTLGDLSATEVEQVMNEVWLMINSIAFFHRDKMQANFVSDGSAFSNDPLITSDMETCAAISEYAVANFSG